MTRNSIVFVGTLVVGLIAVTLTPGQAQTRSAQQDSLCSLASLPAGRSEFSPGWTHTAAGASYRCVPTFDPSLKPNGSAWVKVESNGTIGAKLPE